MLPAVISQEADPRPAPPGWRRPLRLIAAYLALVAVPVVAVVVLLWGATPSGSASAPTAPTASLYRLLFALATMIGLCAAAGAAARRLGQPAVVGEILVGILMGPSLFGVVWPGAFKATFSAATVSQIGPLAQLGVVLFVFLAGLEFDTRRLRGRAGVVAVTSHVSIAIPALIGVLLAFAAYRRFGPADVAFLPFALFLGVSMSITALPVMVRILEDLGWYDSPPAIIALTSATVGDVTAWILLAVVVALTRGVSMGSVLVIAAFSAVFVLLVLALVPRWSARLADRWPRPVALGAVVVVLLCAATTERIGIHAIFGAFVFGVACRGDHPAFAAVRERIEGAVRTLLLPLFFALSGLRTDIGAMWRDPSLWVWTVVVVVAAVVGKLGGATIGSRVTGLDWHTALSVGALMNCRGLTELIVLNVGLELGVIDTRLFTIMVMMALISTAMTSPLLNLLARRSTGDRPSP
jgi:Kef-type K+ transport system membrane component KefB